MRWDSYKEGQLTVIGAVPDFADDLHQGAGKLNIINVNGETNLVKLDNLEALLAKANRKNQSASNKLSGSTLLPEMATRLCRDWPPCLSSTLRSGTSKRSAMKRSKASFARPSMGGAARRIFKASPCSPAISLRFAPG